MRLLFFVAAALTVSPVFAQLKPNGGYTSAQASRGASVYVQYCAQCHGASLQGESGPPLAGQVLRAAYGSGTAAQLYDFISRQMPLNKPGSLKQWEYLDVTAYILSRNGIAAGTTALGIESLSQEASRDCVRLRLAREVQRTKSCGLRLPCVTFTPNFRPVPM